MFQKNKKKLWIVCLLGLGLISHLFAEGPHAVIDLIVLDGQTGKFFPNAKVSGIFEDTSGNKTDLTEKNTDARGQYIEFVTSAGKFVLHVSVPGYQTESVEGEVKGTDVRVSRRVRSRVSLKKEPKKTEPAQSQSAPKDASAVKGSTSEVEAVPMSAEKILSETGWGNDTAMHQALLDALFLGDVHLGSVVQKLCAATLSYQEPFLRGLLQMAKDYTSSEGFVQNYLQRRKEWYKLENDSDDTNLPKSSKELIRKRLEWFLDESATVDFKAETKTQDCVALFVNEEYERKSKMWKKCYRAGPKLTNIARAFAQEWLASLGK